MDGLDGRMDGWMLERNSPDCICVCAGFRWWGLRGDMFVSVCEATESVGMAGDLEDITGRREKEKQSKSKTCHLTKEPC